MLSRRDFLGSTVGAGAALATGAQPALTQPAKRTIVDCQVHFWTADLPDYPWDPGAKPQLPEPLTIERALPLMDEAGVHRAVVVPASISWSNNYAFEAAKRHPDRFRVVGRIRADDPKGAPLLAEWKKRGMLGVRLWFNNPTLVGQFKSGATDWYWPAAEKAGLPVMLLAIGIVDLFELVAQRHPGLPMLFDHVGLNAAVMKQGKAAETIGHLVALAKYPNVSVKLSNIPGTSLEPYPFRDMTDHLKRVFDAYGPQRCYWGSDISSGFARANWRQRLTHFTEELNFLSESDKDWVLGRAIQQRLNWT